MPLTALAVRSAKPKDKPYKLADFGGLYLLVRPDGARYWRMDYRWSGKRKTLAFGVYNTVSLSDAREKRDSAKKQLANGEDPGLQRRLEKIAAASGGVTFREVAEEFLEKRRREGVAEITIKKNQWLLVPAYKVFGDRPIVDVTEQELLHALKKFEDRERYDSAHRLRTVAGMIFRFAMYTGRATRDLSVNLRGALVARKVKHRPAITDPMELGAILRAFDGYTGQPTTRMALQLMPLVFLRPGELRSLRWKELDLSEKVWRVPAETMKTKRPLRVPLTRQALAIIQNLYKITGSGEFVFPAITSVRRPLSENTLNAALRRLGYTKDEVCAHGFRTTASSLLNDMSRWNKDAIERQLDHKEGNKVREAYMHAAEFWDQRVELMQYWADYLDQLRLGSAVR